MDELEQARSRLTAAHRGKDRAYDLLAQAVLTAMDEEGRSVHEVAAVLGFTPGRVYQLRDRARGKTRPRKATA